MKRFQSIALVAFVALTVDVRFAVRSQAANGATDYLHFDSTYDGGWASGQNGGIGFGPWTLTATSGNPSMNGFFVGTSTNNGAGGSGIDTKVSTFPPPMDPLPRSWGLYANNGNTAVAYRSLTGDRLAIGQTVTLYMDNGYVDAGSYVGVIFRTGPGTTNKNDGSRLEFFFPGGNGNNDYYIADSNGVQNVNANVQLGDTPAHWTDSGLSLTFVLLTADTYRLHVATRQQNNGGLGPIDGLSNFGTGVTVTGTLAGVTGAGVNSIALYNQNAGNGAGNDLFFNGMSVSADPIPKITGMNVVGGTNAFISFTSISAEAYELQSRDAMSTGSWATVTNNIPGNGSTIQLQDAYPSTQTMRFYRVKGSYSF